MDREAWGLLSTGSQRVGHDLVTEQHHVKNMVGGAVLTADYAKEIGADHYAKDAMEAVRYAETFLA